MKDEYLKEIKEIIENADKVKDLYKIKVDIDNGLQLLKVNDICQKDEYLKKIENDYYLYVRAMQLGFTLRTSLLGFSSIKNLINYNEKITQYVRMLQLVYDGKLYDEIIKIINGENNVFIGGEIVE